MNRNRDKFKVEHRKETSNRVKKGKRHKERKFDLSAKELLLEWENDDNYRSTRRD